MEIAVMAVITASISTLTAYFTEKGQERGIVLAILFSSCFICLALVGVAFEIRQQ